jgi:protein-ribulosamine 3-kinase
MQKRRALADYLAKALGLTPGSITLSAVAGGCINRAAIVDAGKTRYFVKHNDASKLAMFEAEADGLAAIRATGTVRVPAVVGTGIGDGRAFLVTEHISLAALTDNSLAALGRVLAALHRTIGDSFGWHRDNTIGSTPQHNTSSDDWIDFWCRQRLGFLLHLAKAVAPGRQLIGAGESLLQELPALFSGYRPHASLLHGDLWAGNAAQTTGSEPVVFDPAVYYGDREADVAMTELFGGFGKRFYNAYNDAWPLDPGYPVRRDLYNLYHVLNHALLFGGGYWTQSQRLITRLRSEIR